MRTFEHAGATINYDPDLSGFVYVTNNTNAVPGSIPGRTLRAFIAHWLRRELIREIEAASDDEILRRF